MTTPIVVTGEIDDQETVSQNIHVASQLVHGAATAMTTFNGFSHFSNVKIINDAIFTMMVNINGEATVEYIKCLIELYEKNPEDGTPEGEELTKRYNEATEKFLTSASLYEHQTHGDNQPN